MTGLIAQAFGQIHDPGNFVHAGGAVEYAAAGVFHERFEAARERAVAQFASARAAPLRCRPMPGPSSPSAVVTCSPSIPTG